MKYVKSGYKKFCAVIAVIMACSVLMACGAPENLNLEYAVGKWKAEYNENGKKYVSEMALNDVGEYGMVVYIDGEFIAAEIGTYTMSEKEVSLYKSGEDAATLVFEYSDGSLINEGHTYNKQND